MPLRLLHFEACPFCEKVRLSIRRMGLAYESEVIDPDDRKRVEEVSGQRLVPLVGRTVITVVAPSQKALSTSNPRGTRATDVGLAASY